MIIPDWLIRFLGRRRRFEGVALFCFAYASVACAPGNARIDPVDAAPTTSQIRRAGRTPPAPCASASQYERARSPRAPDEVWPPFATTMTLMPRPTSGEPRAVNVEVTVRIDSVGRITKDSLVITGVRTDEYREAVVERVVTLTFFPATLSPDNCAVSGKATIRFSYR